MAVKLTVTSIRPNVDTAWASAAVVGEAGFGISSIPEYIEESAVLSEDGLTLVRTFLLQDTYDVYSESETQSADRHRVRLKMAQYNQDNKIVTSMIQEKI